MKTYIRWVVILTAPLCVASPARSQSLGNAGTIEGAVTDQSAAAVSQAEINIHNNVSGYSQSVVSGPDGAFQLVNVPPGQYHLEVNAQGFSVFTEELTIRNSLPVQMRVSLAVAGANTTVTVEGAAEALETDPSAHVAADRNLLLKIPAMDPGAGLSQAIIYTTGGVASDGNGFFHPLGDHAQVTFVIDGQPISDQQSKVFSTQLPVSAVQSMELITGNPGAEFGDKTSLIAQVTTRSGLGAGRMFGNIDAGYGSFGSAGGSLGLGWGAPKFGNFLAVDGVRSGRFLDTPEFTAFHDKGNNQTIFDHLDFQPNGRDAIHLNLLAARNWIQIPNDYDQLFQDQRQRVLTWSIAPGYQHTFNAHTLLTVNPYIRKDEFFYYGSRDLFDDTPATQNQQRQLLNWGTKADMSFTAGHHNLKVGVDLTQTRLREDFGFGITDPTFNPICVDSDGDAAGPLTLLNPAGCAKLGLQANPDLREGLVPYDLSRGGGPFRFHATRNINQFAGYFQDAITAGQFLFNFGFRVERYNGVTSDTGVEPRAGIAYRVKRTDTVLRVAYARTFETPFNENLLLTSATGAGELAENVFGADAVPIRPGRRNQFNTGLQQAIGRFLLVDADCFWKYTHNAYDFDVLLNTTITFPIAWHNSKLDGVTGRISTTNLHGFRAYWTFGHTRARYFPPENGGLVSQGQPLATTVFRIDHDQAFQSTANLRYQQKNAEWIAWTWRYDSGLAVTGVLDVADAVNLTPAQQVTIGFACDGRFATLVTPITSCTGVGTSKLLTLPQIGQENDDHRVDRVKPRNVFNLGIGTDNLRHNEGKTRITASVSIDNITNKVALYNFLSTFSGTHFLQPRAVVAHIGLAF